ncbi:unnamed protein product [Linum trigynum]|uniref:CCHC-type domain-containing protein n=1 Tax=Linum trigynum TaxID=586398 RepID=A0AAV2GUG1_9ROSI
MVVWIQFSALPVHFYHKEVLFSLGNMIGRAIKLDFHTHHQQRAKFARMAVELDLSKPLVTRIRLDGQWQYIEYENLPTVCFECGKIGHTSLSCPNLIPTVQCSQAETGGASPEYDPATVSEEKEGFGPWMQVTRRSRGGNRNPDKGNARQSQGDLTINGKNGKGKNSSKDMKSSTGSKGGAKEIPVQQDELGKQSILEKGKNAAVAHPKGKEKIGKEFAEVAIVGKGILGPIPISKSGTIIGPNKDATHAQRKDEVDSIKKGSTCFNGGPIVGDMKDRPTTSSPPKDHVSPGPNRTSIQIISVPQYDTKNGRKMSKDTPSAAIRIKSQKNQKKKKTKSPRNSQVSVATKALQVWTSVKEKKNKMRTRMASLTLQEIAAWTGAAKMSPMNESPNQETNSRNSEGSSDPAMPLGSL